MGKFSLKIIGLLLVLFFLNGQVAQAEENRLETFAIVNDERVYLVDNQIDVLKNGLVQDVDSTWYFLNNGKVDTNYTGLVLYQGEWFYVESGVLNWSYTGLTLYYGTWYYVENGHLNWGYTGLTLYYGTWYYVEGGQLNWSYSGLVLYYGEWYYVAKGILDWSYTNVVLHHGTWYYVENGHLNWGYTGLTLYYGTWYYVEKGQLNWEYTGLTLYYGTWYYVENGRLNWNYTGVTHYYGTDYYVEGGRLNWQKTGGFVFGNKNLHVHKGVVSYPRILTLGDSITQGLKQYSGTNAEKFFVNTWPKKFNTLYGGELVNGAISGGAIVDQTFRGLIAQVNTYDFRKFDMVIVAFGTNDFSLGTTLESVKQTLRNNLQKIYQQNKAVQIIGVLPHNVFWTNGKWVADGYVSQNKVGITLNEYCDAIAAIYNEFHISYIDWRINPVVTNANRKQLFWDATHPTELGLQIIGERIYTFINGL